MLPYDTAIQWVTAYAEVVGRKGEEGEILQLQ
jgi:hypothetical protein